MLIEEKLQKLNKWIQAYRKAASSIGFPLDLSPEERRELAAICSSYFLEPRCGYYVRDKINDYLEKLVELCKEYLLQEIKRKEAFDKLRKILVASYLQRGELLTDSEIDNKLQEVERDPKSFKYLLESLVRDEKEVEIIESGLLFLGAIRRRIITKADVLVGDEIRAVFYNLKLQGKDIATKEDVQKEVKTILKKRELEEKLREEFRERLRKKEEDSFIF